MIFLRPVLDPYNYMPSNDEVASDDILFGIICGHDLQIIFFFLRCLTRLESSASFLCVNQDLGLAIPFIDRSADRSVCVSRDVFLGNHDSSLITD